ncbi:GNAT family N-acetyltransferase [Janibacter sp. Y6]|uniref:GNAT family N-acetyltransferase n=1 Tax=Janibacter sp. Y6 TaxID=2913552 RepID=UPI0034A35DE5
MTTRPTTIAGVGLALRPPRAEDADALGQLVGDVDRSHDVVAGWVRRWERDGFGSWVVAVEDEPVGFVGVRPREDDIALTVRSTPAVAADGRARAALRLAVADAIEWLPDVPLRLRVAEDDPTTRAVAESSGLVHVPEDDHEARGTRWQVLESPYVRTFTTLPPRARRSLVDLWVRVNDAGGAVGFVAGAPREDVEAEVERREDGLASGHLRGVGLMTPAGDLVGAAFLRTPTTPLQAHIRSVESVMVDPQRRGASLGRHLMAGVHRAARDEGVEILTLDYRDGVGLGQFYAKVGYTEVGRQPGVIRVAPGDDRDSVLLWRRLAETPAPDQTGAPEEPERR